MSGNQSWRRSFQSHHEDATVLVRKLVGVLRAGGENTESALSRMAPALRSTGRRMRTLFYEDGIPVVTREEWTQLRRHAARFFFERAAHHRTLAAKCEAEAEALQRAEQLELWDRPEWHGNVGQRGRTAVGQR